MKLKAEKLSDNLEVREDKLVRVERWNVPVPNETLTGEVLALREYVKPCGARVMWEGRLISASILRHFIETGEWVTRAPKGERKPFRAQVRQGEKLVHLGYFATREERDATIFAFKLGVRA
jgi:hypothetical protein